MPSNPEASYFQLAEAILGVIKDKSASFTKDKLKLKCMMFIRLISYLSSQLQDKLPYEVPGVDSNDKIFIGNEGFKREADQLLDYLFDQILEEIATLNEIKQQHFQQLHDICMDTASCLMINCALSKKIDNFINKLFKMADQYVTEHNSLNRDKQLSKVRITQTYESYKKKKDAIVQHLNMRASVLQVQQPQPQLA